MIHRSPDNELDQQPAGANPAAPPAPKEKAEHPAMTQLFYMIGSGVKDKKAYGDLLMEVDGPVRAEMSAALGRAFGPEFVKDAFRVLAGMDEQYKPAVGAPPVMSAAERKQLNDSLNDKSDVPAPPKPQVANAPDERKPQDPYAPAPSPLSVSSQQSPHAPPVPHRPNRPASPAPQQTPNDNKAAEPQAEVAQAPQRPTTPAPQNAPDERKPSDPNAPAPSPLNVNAQAEAQQPAPPVQNAPVHGNQPAPPKVTESNVQIGSSSQQIAPPKVEKQELLNNNANHEHEGSESESEEHGEHGANQAKGPMQVTASVLRIRSSPTTGDRNNIVGKLNRGAVVKVVGHQGAWAKIKHGGKDAWVHSSYLKPAQEERESLAGEDEHEQRALV